MKVFCRLDGKLAQFEVATNIPFDAIDAVSVELKKNHVSANPILALVEKPIERVPSCA
jgi:hypothetical protein